MNPLKNDKKPDLLFGSFESMQKDLDSMIFHMQALKILLDPTISIQESNMRIEELKIKLAITEDEN